MGRSANRTGDEFLCEEHPSAMGRVTAGSGDVNEAQRPVTRLGDPALCPGESLLSISPHTSFATEGSATVLINGRPAVRHGDRVAPGGSTLFGADMVFIGGPGVAVPANLLVEGTDAFKAAVFADLGLIAGTPSGQRLLADIERGRPRMVRIVERGGADPGVVDDTSGLGLNLKSGRGGDARVYWNPDWKSSDAELENRDAVLFHELMHARGHVHGHHYPRAELSPEKLRELTRNDVERSRRGEANRAINMCEDGDTGLWVWCGENRAMGTYPYEDNDLSENTYRRDRGYGLRTTHHSHQH